MNTSLTDPPTTEPDPPTSAVSAASEDLEHQRAAIARLGHELRALVEATVRTAAAPDTLGWAWRRRPAPAHHL